MKATTTEIFINGRNSSVEARLGETLLSCLRRARILVESTCDSRGVCGRCRVIAHGALTKPNESESAHLVGLPPDVRLACMATVMGPVHVTLNDDWTRLTSLFDLDEVRVPVDSPVKRITLSEIEQRSSRPYIEILPYRVTDPRVLNQIVTWDHKANTAVGIVFEDELLDVRFDQEPVLGVAVDLGTTSLSLYAFNLETGDLIGRSSAINPQTAYGGDVITRINYCRETSDGTQVLAETLITKLGSMLDEAGAGFFSRNSVYLMTVAGNTSMLHILAGVQPVSLALAPFRPAFLNRLVLSAGRSGMPIHSSGRCVLLPGASAYVGADIIAGLIAINYGSRAGVTLFIDIGTNGEMVLIEGPDRLLGTSCAVGPALEGMNITCGSRAVPGAVDSFMLDGALLPHFKTIGGAPAEGICGSGLVDLIAALVRAGLITSSGAFNPNAEEPLVVRMKGDRYYLADNIFLTQRDVRQVQLAKSAVASGILTLLKEAGRSVRDLDEIVVAGSFGYHLDADNLRLVGFLPKEFEGKVSFVGNSSLSGAAMALLNEGILRDMDKTACSLKVVELGSHPLFRSHFISSLQF